MKMETKRENEMKTMTRNIESLDCVKGVACIFVILIHCTFPGMAGEVLRAMARFAVPLFFAVTGYFLLDSHGNVTKERILRKLKHIIRITVLADIFYVFFRFGCFCILGGGTVQEVFIEHLTLEKFVRFALTNSPFFYSHLWFLYALIYSYVVLYVIAPKSVGQKWKCIYVIMALGIFTLCSEVLPSFGFPRSFTVFHIGIHNFFLLRAFPFIIMGLLIRENSQLVLNIRNYSKKRNVMFILAFAGISVAERFAFVDSQFYIGSYIMVILILTYCVRNPDGFSNILRYIGRSMSLYVYVIQYAVIEVLDFFSTRIVPNYYMATFNWIKPILCIVVVLGVSTVMTKVNCCKQKVGENR